VGKISEYQSRQLVSSAVGVPSQDRSGEIIAAGLQQGVQGVVGLLSERKALADDLASDVEMGKLSLAHGEAKAKAMTLYRDRPEAFPKAVRDHGMKLVEDFSSRMDPSVATSFRKKAMGFIAGDTANSMSWARNRDQEIIVGNVQKGFNQLELSSQSAQDPGTLKNILAGIDSHAVKAERFIDFNSANTLKERTKTAAKENALSGLILSDSKKAVSALESGAFKDILEPNETAKYLKMAKIARIADATVEQYRSLTTSGAQISEMSTRMTDGTLPISEVNLQLEWAKLHENDKDVNGEDVVPKSYIQSLEDMRDIVLKQDVRTAEQKRLDATEYLKVWQTSWGNYLFNKKGAFGRADTKANVKDYNDVIGMYAKAVRAHREGILSDVQFATTKRILDTDLKAKLGSKNMSAGITEALNNAATKRLGFWDRVFNPKENVYSAGYAIIGEHFKGKNLPIAEKQRQTEYMLVKFTETLDAMPQEQRDKIENAEKSASDILNGRKDTTGKQISPGLFNQLEVIRNERTGEIYHKNQIVVRNGIPYAVAGVDEQGKTVFLPVKAK
jgi:hypothetical protein